MLRTNFLYFVLSTSYFVLPDATLLTPSFAPQERISSALRADFVLPSGQDFVREADFVSPISQTLLN